MLSQTTEYVLRAVTFIASLEKNTLCTIDKIADATSIPRGYLAKLLKKLSKEKLLSSKRGIGGGFILNKEPKDITLLEVVSYYDKLEAPSTCPLSINGKKGHLCSLNHALQDAVIAFEKKLAKTTIKNLLDNAHYNGNFVKCLGVDCARK